VRRWPALAGQFLSQRSARISSIILVAEFCHTVVPLAWLLSRLSGAALIFDPGISFYDEMVVCQRAHRPTSFRAQYLKALDGLAFRLPDVVMWFTPIDEEYFGRLYQIPNTRSAWLPPGIDEALFTHTSPPESQTPFIVHWDGSFIASHGIDAILQSAHILREHSDIIFELVGDGPLARQMRTSAETMGLSNVIFFGSVPASELAASVQRAHVCLGAFRGDDKQRRSLYTKELQAMFAGRPVITADGEAKRRVFVAGRDLWLIPPDSPSDLADALLALRNDPAKRYSLASSGRIAVSALCTSDALRLRLTEIAERALNQRHRGIVGQNPSPPL